jgi:DNA polymerase I - 3''-5'' exonuclease and polymerase domains
MNIFVPGTGNPYAKILFIGEAPSFEEENALKPFVGPAGRLFDECLHNAGIVRSDVWITNVFKQMIVPQQKFGRKIPAVVRAEQAGLNVQESIQVLRTEIDEIKPNVICLLGGTALWALSGKDKITPWRGSILSLWSYKCIPTFHPATLLYGEGEYWQKYIIEFDFRRVLSQSEYPEIRRPSRNLSICHNSAQLSDFIERNNDKDKLSVDIEALRCIPVCVSLAFDSIEGLCVPLWNSTSITRISDIPSSDLASIWNILYLLLKDKNKKIIGQNFKYDQDKLRRLGFVISNLYSDTLLKHFAISPELPHNLAFQTSIYTEEPYYKDEGLEFDYTKHDISDLLLYGAKDAPVTWEIEDKQEQDLVEVGMHDFYYNFLMKLHDLYSDIENVGFPVNEKAREKLLRKYISWSERLSYELFKYADAPINCDSWQQVDKLLYEVMKIPRRQGTGEEVLTQLLANVVKKDDQKKCITNILEQRRVNKTIGTYLMAMNDYDGRMRTACYIPLDTGRTSTGLQDPPIRPYVDNFRNLKGKIEKKKCHGAAFQTLTKHGDVGGDIRLMYSCDPGCVLLNIDSSQAEARVIALLSDDEVTLKLYDTNDIHALTASWFLGGDEFKYSKKVLGYECPERFLGKTLRHAGHLGAKGQRAATEVNTQARKAHIDINISKAFADKALLIFHNKSPKVQQVFQKGIIAQLEIDRTLIAPVPYGVDSTIGGKRTFHEKWSDELFRQAFSYIPQRAISDNTKASALRIRERLQDIRIVVESHDSLTFMVEINDLEEVGRVAKEELEMPISFKTCSLSRRDLVIPAELEVGTNYKELVKYKV